MRALIFKLNATGDVVRTTALLRRFVDGVVWVTSRANTVLIDGLPGVERCLTWEQAEQGALSQDHFDLVINLEDEPKIAALAIRIGHDRLFGAYTDNAGRVAYSEDARSWFDLSLVSRHGKAQADHLKWLNRRSYQDLIFEGLGFTFVGERYCLPEPTPTGLTGDVAIAPNAGPVWPMKGWAHYEALRQALRARGLIVNVLPQRATLLEHLGDVAGHRCLVSGDSLPMHLALGAGVRCVTIFNCTSPWEIHGYGLQTQVVSPLLEDFFYKRHVDERAMTAVSLDDVLDAVQDALEFTGQRRQVPSPAA
jgi:ADP-heptose:LPS heptosyltransferase